MGAAILTENLAKTYKKNNLSLLNLRGLKIVGLLIDILSRYKTEFVVSKREGPYALTDLNLEVNVGDIFGFIGPNGAGKTTTIKILMGLMSATKGKAWLMGKPAGSVEAKKNIGYLSEIAYFYPFMEVGKLLDFYCSFYDIPRGDRAKRIDEVLSIVKLSEKKNAKISELSKGMQQRFGIAQAIIADPPLLILDELTSGLDPIAQKEVKDVVLELKKRGKTIFFSSHTMTEVEMICDKIGIVHKGRMLKCAGLDDFLKEGLGELTKFIYKDENAVFDQFLKEKHIESNKVSSELASFIIPSAGASEMIDKLRESKLDIIEIIPHKFSLEDAFFKLVKEAEKR